MKKLSFASVGKSYLVLTLGILVTLSLFSPVNLSPARASDTNSAPAASRTDDTNSLELMRTYLQLQEQLHATQLAIEQNRKEAKDAATANAEFLAGRLHDIETALAAQRARELEAMQSSNRVMLIVAGTFATFGFVVMLLVAYFQWRTVHGLAEMSTALPAPRALSPPSDAPLVSIGPAEQSTVRLLGALERLEKRIYELEQQPESPLQEGDDPTKKAHATAVEVIPTPSNGDPAGHIEEPAHSQEHTRLEVLLGKGLSMLNLDKPDVALRCFDEVLSLDPGNSEALVRRGIALERLQMPDEALESYDRAIAADGSMTIAYLHKGGLFNRLERFDEALACYEQALRTQERSR